MKDNNYYLMPFQFERISATREVLVNESGDYLIVDKGTVNKIVTKKINETTDPNLYADLVSNYFISEQPIHPLLNLLATKLRTKRSYLDDFTGLHIFAITLRCDHNCEYCQVSRQSLDNSKYDMSLKTIENSIDLMLLSPGKNLTMEFQGGEPLLVFDKVKYAIELADKKAKLIDKELNYVICTNLSRINKGALEFCNKYNVFISTSLDGPEHIHNFNRKLKINSYKKAISGINLCKNILGKDKVSPLMTTSKYSLNYPFEIIDEYRRNGFSNIFLRPINPYGYALRTDKNRYTSDEFLDFYKKALSYIISLNKDGEFFVEDYARIILKKILTPFNVGFVDLQSPAGIVTGVIVYNRDGNVYASDESRMLGEMNDFTFLLGNVNKDSYEDIFYGKKVASLTDFMLNETLAGCSNCAFQTYCGADPVHNYATQGSLYGHRPTNAFCYRNKEIIKYLLHLMDSDKSVLSILKSWVTNSYC